MKTCCGFVPLKFGAQLIAFFVGCVGLAGFIASVVILSTQPTHVNLKLFHFDRDWIYILFVIIAVVDITSGLVLYFGIRMASYPMILSCFICQCCCFVGLAIIFVVVASAQMVVHICVILILLGCKIYFMIVTFRYCRSISNQGMVIKLLTHIFP
jgi:hypothetical protein